MRFHLDLGLLALAACSFWPPAVAIGSAPTCGRAACRTQIDAMCGSLGG